jgi:hypothetical protein
MATAFEGLRFESTGSRTVLVGTIADQAQLHGHLARIRDLGLDLEALSTAAIPAVPAVPTGRAVPAPPAPDGPG